MWEIYANGSEPYPGLTRVQTRARIVVQNYRMKMPDVSDRDACGFSCVAYVQKTPAAVDKLVRQCWDKNPDKRPAMTAIYA